MSTEPNTEVNQPVGLEDSITIIEPEEIKTPFTLQSPNKLIKYRRSWKEKLEFLQNFKFFAIFLVPVFLIWLLVIKPDTNDDYQIIEGCNITIKPYLGLFVLLVVGSYFLIDCMPLPGAALVPLIAYPLLKIMDAKAAAEIYMKNANMMHFATILLALSGSSAGLTKRMALKILATTGGDFRKCYFLVITVAALMSMWYPDTSVMMFMMDVMEKMVIELKNSTKLGSLGDDRMKQMQRVDMRNDAAKLTANAEQGKVEGLENAKDIIEESAKMAKDEKLLGDDQATKPDQLTENEGSVEPVIDESKFMEENDHILDSFVMYVLLGVGIIVNIGGLYWPYCSTGAIQLMKIDKPFIKDGKKHCVENISVDMGVWMSFAGPVMAIMLPLTILYLDFYNFVLPTCGCPVKICKNKFASSNKEKISPLNIKVSPTTRIDLELCYSEKYLELGNFNSHEMSVMYMLLLAEVFFITSDARFIGGWSIKFKTSVTVSSIAMLIAVCSFAVPKCGRDMFRGPTNLKDKASFTALIGWKIVQSNFPWGLLIFIGGGLAISLGSSQSNMSKYISIQLMKKMIPSDSNLYLDLLILMLIAFLLACLVSNTAAAGIMKSIILELSLRRAYKHSSILVPCIAVTALAFVSPQGTPALALFHMRSKNMHIGRYCQIGVPLAVVGFFVIYVMGVTGLYLDKNSNNIM